MGIGGFNRMMKFSKFLIIFLVFIHSVAFGFGRETTKTLDGDCPKEKQVSGFALSAIEVFVYCDAGSDGVADFVLQFMFTGTDFVPVLEYEVYEAEALRLCAFENVCDLFNALVKEDLDALENN